MHCYASVWCNQPLQAGFLFYWSIRMMNVTIYFRPTPQMVWYSFNFLQNICRGNMTRVIPQKPFKCFQTVLCITSQWIFCCAHSLLSPAVAESLKLIFKFIEQIFTVFKSLAYTTLNPEEEERQISVALPKFKRGIISYLQLYTSLSISSHSIISRSKAPALSSPVSLRIHGLNLLKSSSSWIFLWCSKQTAAGCSALTTAAPAPSSSWWRTGSNLLNIPSRNTELMGQNTNTCDTPGALGTAERKNISTWFSNARC